MASSSFINQKISEYQDAIRAAILSRSPLDLHNILRLFAKDVERETRHKAADLAAELARKITNL
jgi:hypothetical protein